MKRKLKELQKHIAYWQKRLGLSNWQLEAKLNEQLEGAYAQVTYQKRYHQAIVEVEDTENADYEFEVVHELVHLVLADYHDLAEECLNSLGTDEQKALFAKLFQDVEEQAINTLSEALINRRLAMRVKLEEKIVEETSDHNPGA